MAECLYVYPYLLFTLLFQTPPASVALLENCAEPEQALATLQAADAVRVRSAMAGGAGTCYAVTATVDGKAVDGYILGETLPAIVDFERQRRLVALPAAEASSAMPAAAATAAAAPAPKERPHRAAFGDFSAVDLKGKPVRLKALQGKAVVICFWSPGSAASIRELLVVSRSYFEFHKQGLDVIAVSLSASREAIEDAFEGSTAFPDIPDRYGISEQHGVSFDSLPRTFILDQRHEIVAAGLHGAALKDAIREAMKSE
jgi:peroxiredoxin